MIRPFTHTRAVMNAVVLAASMLAIPAVPALAQGRIHHHATHHFDRAAAASYSAYAGTWSHVPYDALVPLKAEVPPPVDPNEPTSGSYGASIKGYNGGTSTP